MANQIIGIGSTANDGTGDSLRVSFDKTNDNFNEVYTLLGDGTTLGSIVSSLSSGNNIDLSSSVGEVSISVSNDISIGGSITAVDYYGSGVNLTGVGSTLDISTNSLVVSGITTLGIVTGATSVQATDFYGKVHGNGGAISAINADNITAGTLPNNRFPNPLPELDGSALVDGKWTIGADGTNNYTFTGIGFTETTADPDIYLARGRKYQFSNNLAAHPFRIQSTPNGSAGTPYNNGVTNNDLADGVLTFEVPFNAPDTLYYQCTSHTGMGGTIFIYPTLRWYP